MIHITTDRLFEGREGSYTGGTSYDELDVYGRTKSLGEPENCLVIRTSIIEEERHHKRSLIQWAKSQAGKEVRGFVNRSRNKLMCLEFAKMVLRLIARESRWTRERYLSAPKVITKLEVLRLMSEVFQIYLKLRSPETPVPCHRTLVTDFPEIFSRCVIPDLRQQLNEIRSFEWV